MHGVQRRERFTSTRHLRRPGRGCDIVARGTVQRANYDSTAGAWRCATKCASPCRPPARHRRGDGRAMTRESEGDPRALLLALACGWLRDACRRAARQRAGRGVRRRSRALTCERGYLRDRFAAAQARRYRVGSLHARRRPTALRADRGPRAGRAAARGSPHPQARAAIDLQTYIFDEDDAGHLVLENCSRRAAAACACG
jgi:hypothetical protein